MRKFRKFSILLAAVLALALVLAFSGLGVFSAEDEGNVTVEDRQLVFGELRHSGEVDAVRVIDWLAFDGDGTVTVERPTGLSEPPKIQGMRQFATPRVEDDTMTWDDVKVDGLKTLITSNTLQGDSVEQDYYDKVPLEITFKYWLDGERVQDLEEIAGEDGHFRLECTMKNTSKEETMVTYTDSLTGEEMTEEVETYLPLVILPYDWYFNNEVFYNLECDKTGTIFYLPTDYQVGWSIPLFPPATLASNTIWVEADVKNFQLEPLTFACAFVFPHTNQIDPIPVFKQGLLDLHAGVGELGTGLQEAIAGVGSPSTSDTLLYAVSQISGGLARIASPTDGLPYAESNINGSMIPGVDTMVSSIGAPGADGTLLYATSAISGGLADTKAGIGAPDAQDTLLFAVDSITGGLETMKAGIGTTTTDETLLYAAQSLIDGLDSIKTNIDGQLTPGVAAIAGGLGGIYNGIGAPATAGTIRYAIDQANAQMAPGAGGAGGGAFYQWLYATYGPGTPDNLADVDCQTISGFFGTNVYPVTLAVADAGLGTGAGPPPGIQYSIGDPAAPAAGTLLDGCNQLTGGLGLISDGIGDIATDGTLLYAASAVKAGLDEFKAGIGSTSDDESLIYAADAILGGLNEFSAGIGSEADDESLLYAAGATYSGLEEISAGIGSETNQESLLYAAYATTSGLALIQGGLSTGSMADPGIREGLVQVSAGLDETVSGIGSPGTPDTLLYGTSQASSGLEELKAGLEMAVNEGTDVMQSELAASIEELDLTDGEIAAITERGEEYDTFLGRVDEPTDTKSHVRVLLQTKPLQNSWDQNKWVLALILACVGALALVGGGIALYKKYV